EELLDFVNEINRTKERGIPVLELILQSVLNVTSGLLFGTRYPLGDPKGKYLAKLAADFTERIHCAPIIQFKPQWLCRLEAKLPFTRTGAMRRCRLAMIDFIRDQIKEHEGTIEADITRDFIDGFLKQVEKHRHDPNSAFQVCHLVANTVELFFGSSSNVPVLVHWLLLVCAQNPERVQARIQKEIDDVVGHDRQPTWEDRKAMPFTMASVLEITRWKVTLPITLPRSPCQAEVGIHFRHPDVSVLRRHKMTVSSAEVQASWKTAKAVYGEPQFGVGRLQHLSSAIVFGAFKEMVAVVGLLAASLAVGVSIPPHVVPAHRDHGSVGPETVDDGPCTGLFLAPLRPSGFRSIKRAKMTPKTPPRRHQGRHHSHPHRAFKVDVGSSSSVNSLFEDIRSACSRVPNIVVNSAGIGLPGTSITDTSEEDFDNLIRVNLKGSFLVTQAAGQAMIAENVTDGTIVNMSSMMAKIIDKGASAYTASKAGVVALTKVAAKELASHGIRVNVVLPSFIETPMQSLYFTPGSRERAMADIPLGRPGLPEEVAEVVKFLCNSGSSFMTGSAVDVSGGQ
ncbi:hypothetical protein HPB47_019336, partial [Ixodes persulcatus]